MKDNEMGDRENSETTKQPCFRKFSTTFVWVFVVALVFTTSAIICTALQVRVFSSPSSTGSNCRGAFFVFGDSYSDVGNIPGGSARRIPYGVTWPGHPAGRFSDGRVQPDYLATQALGCPSPSAYANSDITSIFQGVNFAVGGAAVTYGYGAPNISTQVGWFESIVNSRIYTHDFLASSVTLVCIGGNDYGSFVGVLEDYLPFVDEVVGLIGQSLRKLSSLGLRNIMVTTLPPISCLPWITTSINFTACSTNATVEDLQLRHDSLLEKTLETLLNDVPGMNFILLRLGDAFKHIQTNPTVFNVSQPFKPCCFGNCGAVDRFGNLLYTLCEDPENHVVWDFVHPTQAAWQNVVNLYLNDQAFTTFAPTLQHWTHQLS